MDVWWWDVKTWSKRLATLLSWWTCMDVWWWGVSQSVHHAIECLSSYLIPRWWDDKLCLFKWSMPHFPDQTSVPCPDAAFHWLLLLFNLCWHTKSLPNVTVVGKIFTLWSVSEISSQRRIIMFGIAITRAKFQISSYEQKLTSLLINCHAATSNYSLPQVSMVNEKLS